MTTTAEKSERATWRQPMFMVSDVSAAKDRIRWIAQQYRPEDRAEFFSKLLLSIFELEKELKP